MRARADYQSLIIFRPLSNISVQYALETTTIIEIFSSSMKSIVLTQSSKSSSPVVGTHNNHHHKNNTNRDSGDVVDNNVTVSNHNYHGSALIENIEKEQYNNNNKLISHNNIKKQVIRNKIIAKNDDKLKRMPTSDNIISGGNNVNFNDFLTSTESHPLIDTNGPSAKAIDNGSGQKATTKFLNLHSKNGTTLIFQRKNFVQSKHQSGGKATNDVEVNSSKKESFKKRQSLQWPLTSTPITNNRNNRHHSWYDDSSRYPNAIEEEFESSVSMLVAAVYSCILIDNDGKVPFDLLQG